MRRRGDMDITEWRQDRRILEPLQHLLSRVVEIREGYRRSHPMWSIVKFNTSVK